MALKVMYEVLDTRGCPGGAPSCQVGSVYEAGAWTPVQLALYAALSYVMPQGADSPPRAREE